MQELFLTTLPHGTEVLCVRESAYYTFLKHAKRLVQDQRRALRLGNKELIADCKTRERALLDYVTQYEVFRQQYVSTNTSKP